MNSTLTQQEKLIMTLTLLFVGAFMAFFFGFNRKPITVSQSEANQINYEMTKMAAPEGLYSLEGREVDRDYEGLPVAADTNSNKAQKLAQIKKGRDKNNGQDGKGLKKDAKKSADQKSKEAAKRYAAEVKAQTSKTAERLAMGQKSELNSANPQMNDAQVYNNNQNFTQTTPLAPTTQPKKDDEKPKKTIADWKKEIMSTGSKEAVLGLAAALKKNEVTDVEFYQLVQEMVSSNDEKVKGLGLYALRATPSLQSFSAFVKLPADQFSSAYQGYVHDSLLSYHQGSLGVLRTALMAADRVVVVRALEILKEGLVNIKSGTTTGMVDPRYRRDPGHRNFSMKDYLSFLPVLVQLGQSAQDISSNVQEIAQLIEAGQAVASTTAFTSSTFQ